MSRLCIIIYSQQSFIAPLLRLLITTIFLSFGNKDITSKPFCAPKSLNSWNSSTLS